MIVRLTTLNEIVGSKSFLLRAHRAQLRQADRQGIWAPESGKPWYL